MSTDDIEELPETQLPAIDFEAADAGYRPFPSFAQWSGALERRDLWKGVLARLEETRAMATAADLERAFGFVMRAAALDTGAIEGLYEVDRGFTYTVAAQGATWEVAMEARGSEVRPFFDAQLHAYELVLDAATKHTPIVEAWLRRLHEEVTGAQENYRVLTQLGWQTRPLPRGAYKSDPNHVLLPDGAVHSYAPVAETRRETARIISELQSPAFQAADPIIQAAYAHYALVAVHPFPDGNGRVARALASVFLYRGASIPLLVFADRKAPYLDALHAADGGDHQPFTTFVFNAAVTATNIVVDNLRAALAPPSAETVERLRDLMRAQGTLTHEDMDGLAGSLLSHLSSAITERLSELSPTFPTGVDGQVARTSREPPLRKEFRPPRNNPTSSIQLALTSASPADGQSVEWFSVQVSKGRDVTQSLVILREAEFEEHIFALDELYPDLSLAGQTRLHALADRVWSELLASLIPQVEQSLREKGYIA